MDHRILASDPALLIVDRFSAGDPLPKAGLRTGAVAEQVNARNILRPKGTGSGIVEPDDRSIQPGDEQRDRHAHEHALQCFAIACERGSGGVGGLAGHPLQALQAVGPHYGDPHAAMQDQHGQNHARHR